MNARLERKLRLLSGIVAAGIAGIAFTAAMEPSPAPRQRMARKSAAGRRLADARPHRGLWRCVAGSRGPGPKGGKAQGPYHKLVRGGPFRNGRWHGVTRARPTRDGQNTRAGRAGPPFDPRAVRPWQSNGRAVGLVPERATGRRLA
jgi:hypothetical protein